MCYLILLTSCALVSRIIIVYTLPELASLNMIIPLNEYVKASGGEDYLNQFYSAMFRNAVVQEGDYIEGFPMMRSTPVLYYNQDMLDEKNISVPTTWEELADAASELTTDTVKGLGIPDNWQDWVSQMYTLLSFTNAWNWPSHSLTSLVSIDLRCLL